MPIKLGTDNVSRNQRDYLELAKRSSANRRATYLARIITDDDIQSGREMVHPDWIEIYRSKRKDLLGLPLPESLINKIIKTFDEVSCFDDVSAVNPKTMHLAFLLGAGASKPKPSGIPTVKELLPDLLERARRLDRADLQRLADFCENSRIDNIEDLLTAATLSGFCGRNPSILSLVGFLIYGRESDSEAIYLGHKGPSRDLSSVAFLQDTLQVLFGLLSSRMLPAEPNAGHNAIAEYVLNKPNSSIITTNYDCCVDLALSSKNAKFSYHIDFANSKPIEGSGESDKTPLIKLHGSLNWYYCETCQQVHLIDMKKTQNEYLNDEICYSVIAVCRECGGQRRGLLVPPLAMKFDMSPPLTPLIEKAQEFFNRADSIVVVGFSFADADMYISRMLTKSMQNNKNMNIIVFDPDTNVAEKLRRQLSLRISNFDKKRVISVRGDCSETLPEFLNGTLKHMAPENLIDIDQFPESVLVPAPTPMDEPKVEGVSEDAPLTEQKAESESCAKGE